MQDALRGLGQVLHRHLGERRAQALEVGGQRRDLRQAAGVGRHRRGRRPRTEVEIDAELAGDEALLHELRPEPGRHESFEAGSPPHILPLQDHLARQELDGDGDPRPAVEGEVQRHVLDRAHADAAEGDRRADVEAGDRPLEEDDGARGRREQAGAAEEQDGGDGERQAAEHEGADDGGPSGGHPGPPRRTRAARAP